MFKKKIYRKMTITSMTVLILLLMYLMPSVVKNDDNIESFNVEYHDDFVTESIYLLDDDNLLVKSSISVFKENNLNDKVKRVVESLLASSDEIIPNGLNRVIPKNTKLLAVDVDENVANLNFSKELLNADEDGYLKMVESISFSVLNLSNINGVSIYVEGTNISGQLPIDVPSIITKAFGINKKYNFKRRDDIKKYVVYYLEYIDNNKYYVPVTKYVNDNREKIQIIIDDLSSSYIYQSNLISVLNEKTQLNSYSINNSEMTLDFNNSVFINKGEIVEEVVYPIVYSVFDNYDVDRVIIKVNGKEIYKKDKKDIE